MWNVQGLSFDARVREIPRVGVVLLVGLVRGGLLEVETFTGEGGETS